MVNTVERGQWAVKLPGWIRKCRILFLVCIVLLELNVSLHLAIYIQRIASRRLPLFSFHPHDLPPAPPSVAPTSFPVFCLR
jgi:hypothetical protein